MDLDFSLFNGNAVVYVVAAAIGVVAIVSYVFWYRPAVVDVRAGVDRLARAFSEDDASWPDLQSRARDEVKSFSFLASSWLEVEDRAAEINLAGVRKTVVFNSTKDLWTPNLLLSRRFNLGLAEAVPNILVGVGLLFTFVFLTIALGAATSALDSNVSSEKMNEAISNLLSAAGGKFSTSLIALLASVLWTYMSKRELNLLFQSIDRFNDRFNRVVPVVGAEILLHQQVDLKTDHLGLTEELLTEAREQTGTFKRFETDLAVTLAEAINKSFSPQMEVMTSKLVDAIQQLSNNIGTINQEALERMMENFASMLKQMTESEMGQLQKALADLASNLEVVGGTIGAGAEAGANVLNSASDNLAARIDEVAKSLKGSAADLDAAAVSVKIAFNDLDVSVTDASEMGRKGMITFNDALEKSSRTIEHLGSVSAGLAGATEAMAAISGKIGDVIDNIEELAREQRAVVLEVRDVAPSVLASVERVSGILETAGNQTQESIETTAETLSRTVSAITKGVTSYTDQIADLHRVMDGSLAKAVGSFDKGVNELAELLEELAEITQAAKRV